MSHAPTHTTLPTRLPFHDPISTGDAARIADCTPEAIRQRCDAGRAEAFRIGRNWWVSMRWAEEYGKTRRVRRRARREKKRKGKAV